MRIPKQVERRPVNLVALFEIETLLMVKIRKAASSEIAYGVLDALLGFVGWAVR